MLCRAVFFHLSCVCVQGLCQGRDSGRDSSSSIINGRRLRRCVHIVRSCCRPCSGGRNSDGRPIVVLPSPYRLDHSTSCVRPERDIDAHCCALDPMTTGCAVAARRSRKAGPGPAVVMVATALPLLLLLLTSFTGADVTAVPAFVANVVSRECVSALRIRAIDVNADGSVDLLVGA